MKKDNKAIKFIFVTGPSESGKSGGIIHIREKFPQVKHLKIRATPHKCQKPHYTVGAK